MDALFLFLEYMGAAGLPGDDGAVRPHGLRDEAAVVREDAGVDVKEVLGEQYCNAGCSTFS